MYWRDDKCTHNFIQKSQRKDLEDLSIDERKILKSILKTGVVCRMAATDTIMTRNA
jgi:hypothetical protein